MTNTDLIMLDIAREFQAAIPNCLTKEVFNCLLEDGSFGLFIWDLPECLACEIKRLGAHHFHDFFEVLEKYIDYKYFGIGIDLQVTFLEGFAVYFDKSIWDKAPQFSIFNEAEIEVIMHMMGKKTRHYFSYHVTK